MCNGFKLTKVFTVLCLVAVFFTGFVCADNNIEFLDKALIGDLNLGIYEVVTPKKENDNIKYSRELPFDRLDFIERNEKYFSIGTAFFINNKELMTAAHVFGLEYFSLLQDFYIRDSEGKVYPVNLIKRYSTQRDMVVFDLKENPEQVHPLHFNGEVGIGDTVFSVGNAQGEGIAYRAGQVASFTPEREYGIWKDIRFTSPASPGNSGGPLLNLKGEVVGLIVKKNESENYNIAVPIKELENLSESGEFHIRNVSVGLVGVDDTLTRDWSYSISLPAPVQTVAEQAQDNLNSFLIKLNDDLLDKVKEKNLPRGERFRSYLRDQSYVKGLAAMVPEKSFKKWRPKSSYREKIPISATQNIYRGKGQFSDLQVIVEKPENMSLKEFLDSPEIVMDNLLKGVSLFRTIGDEKISITSFGKPASTSVVQDGLGRKWITSLWDLPHSDSFVHSSCLPFPKGVICNVDNKRNAHRKYGYFDDIQDNFNEIVVGYSGEIKDWVEYFSLGESYLPALFKSSKITLDNNTLHVQFDAFKVTFTNDAINGDSSIHLHLGYSNTELLAEDILLFEIFPEKGSKSHYRVQSFYQPSSFSDDSYVSRWKDVINGEGEYSGKRVDRGEKIVLKKAFSQTKKTVTVFPDTDIEKIFAAGCYYKVTDEDIENDCDNFFKSITFN